MGLGVRWKYCLSRGTSFTLFLADTAGFRRRDLGLKAQVMRPHEPQSTIVQTLDLVMHPVPWELLRFYNGRGTAEQWIKEGKYALNWTRLSCHKFVANQVRLWLFVLTYNLGNFMRRLVLPEDMKHWTLTSLQTRMIKTGGRLVRHARRLVFQLAEVLVSREMLCGILERIGRLRLAPG